MVHVVAKTHLDLGFTALAAEVEQQYLTDFFPRAIVVAAELRRRGGPEGLVWTTGSWILHRALAAEAAAGRAAVADAVARGDLAWHAYPFTTHTELMDVELARAGLGISQELDQRFRAGRPTTAAKMTDVPGHTRGLVPLLAEAGVTFFHVGVNPAWPVPDLPPVFRWRAPDDAEITVAYQSGGYGGEVVVPGCDEALAFLHSGDNLGPPTADQVVAAHAALAHRFPGADVRASTLDAFARALAASGAEADLPVVTAEIGDPWIFGCASDPQKLAAFRREMASFGPSGPRRAGPGTTRIRLERQALLPVVEHTWGLDQKSALPEEPRWDRLALADLRRSPGGRRLEASWAEQRAYLPAPPPGDLGREPAAEAGPRSLEDVIRGAAASPCRRGAPYRAVAQGERVATSRWEVEVDATGALAHLVDRRTGRVIADGVHRLGSLAYQSFDQADYARFYAGLDPAPSDEWWAVRDNTKPGIDRDGARSGTWRPSLAGAWWSPGDDQHWSSLRCHLRFADDLSQTLGAPPEAWVEWSFNDPDDGTAAVAVVLHWAEKPANRLPEALWCSFAPVVAEPERWRMDKLGQWVSPHDVVRRGGRSLHGVGLRGLRYDGPDGSLAIRTLDAGLVAPGRPNLLDADPPLPDLAGGWHVLLHDNCWGTNFPMWDEGPASFTFEVGP